jgi:hypothetical protein
MTSCIVIQRYTIYRAYDRAIGDIRTVSEGFFL